MAADFSSCLRELEDRDLPHLRQIRRNANLQRQLMAFPGDLSDIDGWLQRRKTDLLFKMVSFGADRQCAGYVQLSRHHHRDGYAYFGIAIAPEQQGHGLGRIALQQLLVESRALGLRKLMLEVLRENERAAALYGSEGFALIGVLTAHFNSGAGFLDVLLMERAI